MKCLTAKNDKNKDAYWCSTAFSHKMAVSVQKNPLSMSESCLKVFFSF